MERQELLEFLAALGEEFCWALCPPVPDDLMVPQDGYEVWRRTFGTDPSPERLAALSRSELEELRTECVRCFECPEVLTEHLITAVSRTLARWPAKHI